jgi:hypothetical protein
MIFSDVAGDRHVEVIGGLIFLRHAKISAPCVASCTGIDQRGASDIDRRQHSKFSLGVALSQVIPLVSDGSIPKGREARGSRGGASVHGLSTSRSGSARPDDR